MSAVDAITARRSIRWYTSDPVPASTVDALLHSATCAPSAHNRQPWRFAVLGDLLSKRRLAEAMAERLQQDRLADGDAMESIAADAQRSVRRIVEAPVVLVVSATMCDMDSYPDARRAEAERIAAIQGTAMAVQNLLLAAHDKGLGACIICAPLFCPAEVIKTLDLPSDWMPQMIVTVGRPLKPGCKRPRRALAEVVLPVCPAAKARGLAHEQERALGGGVTTGGGVTIDE